MKMWCIVSLLCVGGILHAQKTELKELLYHDTSVQDPTLELGKLVMLFSSSPQYTSTTKTGADGNRMIMFIFDQVALNKNVFDAVERFNKLDKKNCTAALMVTPSEAKVVLRIVYNPHKVVCEYDFFDSIKLDKGLICTFYNKSLLDALSRKQDTVLKMVSSDRYPGVVIDCGHGGSDTGTIGLHPIAEKDITLSIGMMVADLLKSEGFSVFCTRMRDIFVPLDVRTTSANKYKDADIFVSIHANSGTVTASGVETFCCLPLYTLSKTLTPDAKSAINALVKKRHTQSLLLAQCIQNFTLESIKKKYTTVSNRGVKQAVSQVLLGSARPSVLIEVGFLSHPLESALLMLADYRYLIARGISNGIAAYFKTLSC